MNNKSQIKESPLFWPAYIKGKYLFVLDETLIPKKMHYIKVKNTVEAVKVIREMKTRAFGQFLVVLNTFLIEISNGQPAIPTYSNNLDIEVGTPTSIENKGNVGASDKLLVNKIEKIAHALNNSRPTFPFAEVTSIVVGWAHKALVEKLNLREYLIKNINGYLQGIRYRRLERVNKIAALIKDGDSVLTHCNVSGELAMAAAICKLQGKEIHFFATETRPYFQGAKLTAWELQLMGAKVTLIADNTVGSVMADGLVNKVIVGSDRSCANGDFANKIGTYQIAVLAKEFEIPFYVLTQPSKKVARGEDMPIEIRNAKELLEFEGKKIISGSVDGFYPGFDIVPHEFVSDSIAIEAK